MGQDFLFSVVFFPILEELKLLSWGIGCHLPFGYIEFDFGELLVGDSQAAHLAIGRQGSLNAPQVHGSILAAGAPARRLVFPVLPPAARCAAKGRPDARNRGCV